MSKTRLYERKQRRYMEVSVCLTEEKWQAGYGNMNRCLLEHKPNRRTGISVAFLSSVSLQTRHFIILLSRDYLFKRNGLLCSSKLQCQPRYSIFFFNLHSGGVESRSTRHCGHLMAYCVSPG
jgi:hypothetical protein